MFSEVFRMNRVKLCSLFLVSIMVLMMAGCTKHSFSFDDMKKTAKSLDFERVDSVKEFPDGFESESNELHKDEYIGTYGKKIEETELALVATFFVPRDLKVDETDFVFARHKNGLFYIFLVDFKNEDNAGDYLDGLKEHLEENLKQDNITAEKDYLVAHFVDHYFGVYKKKDKVLVLYGFVTRDNIKEAEKALDIFLKDYDLLYPTQIELPDFIYD